MQTYSIVHTGGMLSWAPDEGKALGVGDEPTLYLLSIHSEQWIVSVNQVVPMEQLFRTECECNVA